MINKIIIQNLNQYIDKRGNVGPIWKQSDALPSFLEDRISISYHGSIRGFHGDKITGKLCICLHGSIRLVAWDIDKKEKYQINLNDLHISSIYIPPNFLLAHQCLSNKCILLYKWTQYYTGPEMQYTVRYDDPDINAKWVNIKPILSKRDLEAKSLKDIYEIWN